MRVPRPVLVRLRVSGGWSRSSPRPWGVAVTGATTDRSPPRPPRELGPGAYGGAGWGCLRVCRPVGAGRAVPRAPGECSHPHHDGPIPTSRTTTDRSHLAHHGGPVAAPRATMGRWPRTAARGRGGGCPPAAAGVRYRALFKGPSRRTEDGYPPPRPRPTHRTAGATPAPTEAETGRRRHPGARGTAHNARPHRTRSHPPPPNPQPPAPTEPAATRPHRPAATHPHRPAATHPHRPAATRPHRRSPPSHRRRPP
ncbi:hypothetical protein M2157_004047 [Streptomyces sp. SAI-127]|nr:hypothetical protein [Streptomyces sp. SAI-127]